MPEHQIFNATLRFYKQMPRELSSGFVIFSLSSIKYCFILSDGNRAKFAAQNVLRRILICLSGLHLKRLLQIFNGVV